MLRLLVLALLLANAGYFAWSQGLLGAWGLAPMQNAEPQRLQQQIRPEAVQILREPEARRPETGAAATAECLLAGPLDEAQWGPVKTALQAWPAGTWSVEPAVQPGSWLVYMGKYDNGEQLARKRAQLRQLGVSFEALADPALEPGLALGRFASEAAANARLQALAEQGVRSARVLQEHPETRAQLLKLVAAPPRLAAVRPLLSAIKLRPCR
ncbi:SPOR domain-containing protein [Ramlibacter sp.]|uniref:SPOR domain-containing protein n=1 Tax=Ramlibacter sp. TaxID=1917967 RepID=UPI002CD5C3B8|nr:SPOR domain-containing protein [Ramlibacter sp.]HWI82512.1 SPOR domain-containing protein [Ramlibacter sp.]